MVLERTGSEKFISVRLGQKCKYSLFSLDFRTVLGTKSYVYSVTNLNPVSHDTQK